MPEPYPYQQEGIERLVRRRRLLLGDEMGLGKTPQALLAAQELDAYPMLVVCPKAAFGVWRQEADVWSGIDTVKYVGSGRQLTKDEPITIASYGNFGEVLNKRAWRLVVFDESHRLRNRRTRTLFQVARRNQSAYLFELSGSPIVSDTDDLWAQLHLLDRKEWSSYWAFMKRYMFSEPNYFGGWDYEGTKNPAELRKRMEPYFLRRLHRDVAPQRPPVTRQPVWLELEGLQKRAYEQMANDMLIKYGMNWIAAPTAIARDTRLRQLLVSPLLLGLEDEGAGFRALRETLEFNPHPAVVFTPFEQAIEPLQLCLRGVGGNVYTISGQMTANQVEAGWQGFKRDPGPRKTLIATVQMSVGWRADTASNCYMLGYDWSPTAMAQAEYRLQSPNQDHPVVAHYFLHPGTFDEHALDILAAKVTREQLALNPNFLFGTR